MTKKQGITSRISNITARSITKVKIHPILHFALLLISLIQFAEQITEPQYWIHTMLKWTNFNYLLHSWTLLRIIAVLCLVSGFGILYTNFRLWKRYKSETIVDHYCLKISGTLAYIISYSLCFPIVKCTYELVSSLNNSQKALSILTILMFFLIIYPFSTLFLTDMSPANKNAYSTPNFPNIFYLHNIYRLIAAIVAASNNQQVLLYMTIAYGIIIVSYLLFKYCIITWRFDHISQLYFAIFIWIAVFRMLELITSMEISVLVFLFGAIIFSVSIRWLLRVRMLSIINCEQSSAQKLKIIYFMLIHKPQFEDVLGGWLLNHYRTCLILNCPCQNLMRHYDRERDFIRSIQQNQAPRNISKFSMLGLSHSSFAFLKKSKASESTTQNKQVDHGIQKQLLRKQECKIWYQLLLILQNQLAGLTIFQNQNSIPKQIKVNSIQDIILDSAQILHDNLNRQYQSLRCAWQAQNIIKNNNFSIFSLARVILIKHRHEELMKHKIVQRDQTSQYTMNFYQLQTKFLKLRQTILKVTKRATDFWSIFNQLSPDSYTLMLKLNSYVKARNQLDFTLSQYDNQSPKSKEDTIHDWTAKVSAFLCNHYNQFAEVINAQNITIPSQDNKDKVESLQKNVTFYGQNAKTAMCIIKLDQGEEFGLIQQANKQFWTFTNMVPCQNIHVNNFIVKNLHEYHNLKMKQFLNKDKYQSIYRSIFIQDGQNMIMKGEFSVQLLPQIIDGMFGVAFFQIIQIPQCIVAVDKTANIVSYNLNFQNKYLEGRNVQEFNEKVTNRQIYLLQNQNCCTLIVQNDQYMLKLCHKNVYEPQNQALIYCQITRMGQIQKENITLLNSDNETQQKLLQLSRLKQSQQNAAKQANKSLVKQRQKQMMKIEKAKFILSILPSKMEGSKVSYWRKFIIAVFIFIGCLSVVASGLTFNKILKYQAGYNFFVDLTQLMQNISQSIYLSRQVNILSFNNDIESLPMLKIKMIALENSIKAEMLKINLNWWDVSFISYQMSQNTNILQSNTIFQMIVQKHFLSALTTYNNRSDFWNFNYVLQQNKQPYNGVFLNFVQMTMNCYYVILPQISQKFHAYMVNTWSQIIPIMLPVVPICGLIFGIPFISSILTIIFRIVITKAQFSIIQTLQKITLAEVNEKLSKIRIYQQNNLKDLMQAQNTDQRVLRVTRKQSHQSQITALQDKIQMTTRCLQTKRQIQQNERKQKLEYSRISIINPGYFHITWVTLIGFIPMIAIGVSLSLFQVSNNLVVWKYIQMRDSYGEKIVNIKFVKSFSYEFGFELDKFKQLDNSMRNQLLQRIQDTYESTRKVASAQILINDQYTNFIHGLNEINFCDSLKLIAEQNGSGQCNVDEWYKYSSTTKNQVLIEYLETARSLYKDYLNLNMSTQDQRIFSVDVRHSKMQRLQNLLLIIELYSVSKFDNYFNKMIIAYQITFIPIALSLLPILIIAWVLWIRYLIKEMNQQVNTAKIMSEFITNKTIVSNNEVKQLILANEHNFYMLG